MSDNIKYYLNTQDVKKPVYEVNYLTNTWRVVSLANHQWEDDFISGKVRKPSYFKDYPFEEVAKPERMHA